MALTEDSLQEKRELAADLQRQIIEEQQSRASLVADKERSSQAEVLDTEIERLRNELEAEKALTAHQLEANGPGTEPQDFNAGVGVAVDPGVPGPEGSTTVGTVDSTGDNSTESVDVPVPVTPAPPADAKSAKGSTSKENS